MDNRHSGRWGEEDEGESGLVFFSPLPVPAFRLSKAIDDESLRISKYPITLILEYDMEVLLFPDQYSSVLLINDNLIEISGII